MEFRILNLFRAWCLEFISTDVMKKYFQVIKLTLEDYFVYRLNFFLWRFRSFIFFLSLFFFWLAIYGTKEKFSDYTKAQMLTYVVGVAFLRGVVLGSRSVDLAGQIRTGEATQWLLRPLDIFKFWFSKDAVDKSLNLFFTILEIILVLWLFKFPFWFPKDPLSYFWFAVTTFLALLLYFYLNFFFSTTAFWIDQIWAVRWLFMIILLEFSSGAFFPLDVLPGWVFKTASLTPFPYLVFFPLKIWLGQVSGVETIKVLAVLVSWLAIFKTLAEKTWQRGLRSYSAYGG